MATSHAIDKVCHWLVSAASLQIIKTSILTFTFATLEEAVYLRFSSGLLKAPVGSQSIKLRLLLFLQFLAFLLAHEISGHHQHHFGRKQFILKNVCL